MWRRFITTLFGVLSITVATDGVSFAQSAPLDLWPEQVMGEDSRSADARRRDHPPSRLLRGVLQFRGRRCGLGQ